MDKATDKAIASILASIVLLLIAFVTGRKVRESILTGHLVIGTILLAIAVGAFTLSCYLCERRMETKTTEP